MESTATRATQHDDPTRPLHVHAWGPIQHDDPPAYLVSAHGPRAFAGTDCRFRACTGRGCEARVCGSDVEHSDVLADLDTPTAARLTTAGASA